MIKQLIATSATERKKMRKENKHKYEIEDLDRKAARKNNWNQEKTTYIGNLGEIAACEYLGISWDPVHKSTADVVDCHGTRYQVKTTQEGFIKARHWLEQKRVRSFDRYIFVVIDEGERFANIEMDTLVTIPHKNSHRKGKFEAIYRK